jgi:aminoglycoside 6'-N-acetyltransferase
MQIAGPTLTLRPVAPADVAALRAIHAAEGVARWWGPPGERWPLEEDEPGLVLLTVWRAAAIVGFIQFWEETDPRYRSAAIDLFVDPAHHREGIASEALTVLVAHLLTERGHHRITIDPALDNAGAIACYAGVGFTPVGVMRAYERDPSTDVPHEALLMELVRLPDAPPTPRTPVAVDLVSAGAGDLDAVVAAQGADVARPFVAQWPRERHAAALAAPDEELLVIRAAGVFAGFVLLAGIGNVDTGIELRRIVATPAGIGLGRAALEQALGRAFEAHGTHRVWLDVRIDNRRARALYASVGFRVDGILREAMLVDGRRHHELLLSLLRGKLTASVAAGLQRLPLRGPALHQHADRDRRAPSSR